MSTAVLDIRKLSPLLEQPQKMIQALDTYLYDLYPPESNHLDSDHELSQSNCLFLGAFHSEKLVGIGAVKIVENYGELKRFYVPPENRGFGIAEAIHSALEFWLVQNKILNSYLETGIHQTSALRLYEKLGYQKTEPFGLYSPDPLSVFLKKQLPPFYISPMAQDFYQVTFQSKLNKGFDRYQQVADQMEQLADRQPGYLGLTSYRHNDGTGVTTSYWESIESIQAWKQNSNHRQAQLLGRNLFYSNYRTRVSRVRYIVSENTLQA